MGTSGIYVIEYLAGLFFFGLAYWLFNAILTEILPYSLTGDVYNLAVYIWGVVVIIYLIIGIWYFIIRIKTWKYSNP